MKNQAESQAKSKLEKLKAELAAKDAQLAKKKAAREELVKRIKALENPKLTRKQDAAVKIAKGVAVEKLLEKMPELRDEFLAVLDETTKSNTVRELLGLTLHEVKRKANSDNLPTEETVQKATDSADQPDDAQSLQADNAAEGEEKKSWWRGK